MDLKTANRLYELRKKNGFSQEALAEKLGISRQSVSKWERAESSPDTENLIALSKLYGITLDELLMGEGSEKSDETNDTAENVINNDGDDTLDNDEEYKKYIDQGYNFIKVGDSVRVGTRGIYVKSKNGENVRVGLNGIKIDSDIYDTKNRSKVYKAFKAFLFPVLAASVFLALGFALKAWWWAWLVFLTIPLYYTFIDAVEKKNAKHFAYPVLAVIIFLSLGLFVPGAWVWCWRVLLTIPFYYVIANIFK